MSQPNPRKIFLSMFLIASIIMTSTITFAQFLESETIENHSVNLEEYLEHELDMIWVVLSNIYVNTQYTNAVFDALVECDEKEVKTAGSYINSLEEYCDDVFGAYYPLVSILLDLYYVLLLCPVISSDFIVQYISSCKAWTMTIPIYEDIQGLMLDADIEIEENFLSSGDRQNPPEESYELTFEQQEEHLPDFDDIVADIQSLLNAECL